MYPESSHSADSTFSVNLTRDVDVEWRVIQQLSGRDIDEERGAVSATAPKLLGWDVSPHAGRL